MYLGVMFFLIGACSYAHADLKRLITGLPPRCPFILDDDLKYWYEAGKCTVTDLGHAPGINPRHKCFTITNCPKDCKDINNQTRNVSETWNEGANSCECNYPQRLNFLQAAHIHGFLPTSYPEWPPLSRCTFEGCRVTVNSKRREMALGETYTDNMGRQCECIVGGNSAATDDAPNYSIKCSTKTKNFKGPLLLHVHHLLKSRTKGDQETNSLSKLHSDGD